MATPVSVGTITPPAIGGHGSAPPSPAASSVVAVLPAAGGMLVSGPAEDIDEVRKMCDEQWEVFCKDKHPILHLQEQFKTPDLKRAFAKVIRQQLLEARPGLLQTVINRVDKDDACNENIGSSGEAHLLTLGLDKVAQKQNL